MGAGKTTYGRKLASALDLEFIDLDNHIEKKHKASIPFMFDLVGESGFRLIEHRTLIDVLNGDNFVLSTGGGSVCYYDNMKLISEQGITVYLKFPPSFLIKRLKNAKRKRPLINNFSDIELTNFVDLKLKEREETYNQAKIIIDGTTMNTKIITEAVLDYSNNQ